MEKQKIYQEAIRNQRDDHDKKKQWELEMKRREDEKLVQLMADNSDLLKRLEED